MKKFIAVNWYKIISAASMFVFAAAFLIFSVKNNELKAGTAGTTGMTPTPSSVWMVVKGNTVYEVSWDIVSKTYKCKPVCNSVQ